MAGNISSKVATVIVLVPLLALAWFLAPMALPVYRWRYMDFLELSKKTGIPLAEISKQYDVTARYAPRGLEDPLPWQIMTMDPTWVSVNSKHDDEDHILVRCTFVSDRDGTPPSKLFLGSGSLKDRYWRARAWRMPPGTLGFNSKRPVVIYAGDSIEKLSIGQCEMLDDEVTRQSKWTNDDKEVEDGFKTRSSP